jgi:hypothetical protein
MPAAGHSAPEPGDVVVPALLRAARSCYGNAIRSSLALAGFEDVPRNGAYVLGGMAAAEAIRSAVTAVDARPASN